MTEYLHTIDTIDTVRAPDDDQARLQLECALGRTFGEPRPADVDEQRAAQAFAVLSMTREYADASPEKLAQLRLLCRRLAGLE